MSDAINRPVRATAKFHAANLLRIVYYLTNFVIQVVAAGLFFNELLVGLGVALHPAVAFVIGVLLGCSWPAWMVYRGLSVSAKGALMFLLIEIATVAALCATIVWFAPQRGTPVTFDGFSPVAAFHTPSRLFRALVFAMLGFCGFDVVSTLAEETRTARKLIPQATILALLLYAVLIVGGTWALTVGGNADQLRAAAEGGRMPINEVARNFWGKGSILVTVTALSATLGLIVATSVGASRVLFASGRSGAAPSLFARLHPQFQVPWPALHLIFFSGLVGAFVVFACIGAYNAYVWWATTSTFFAMITFLFSNLAAIVLNRHRLRASVGSFLLFGVVPTLGILFDLYILTQSFFIELWAHPWATGKSVVVFDVACALFAVALAVSTRRTEPESAPAQLAEAVS